MGCIGKAPAIGFVLFPDCTTSAHSRYNPKALSVAVSAASRRLPEGAHVPRNPTHGSHRLGVSTGSCFVQVVCNTDQTRNACDPFPTRLPTILRKAGSMRSGLHL